MKLFFLLLIQAVYAFNWCVTESIYQENFNNIITDKNEYIINNDPITGIITYSDGRKIYTKNKSGKNYYYGSEDYCNGFSYTKDTIMYFKWNN